MADYHGDVRSVPGDVDGVNNGLLPSRNKAWSINEPGGSLNGDYSDYSPTSESQISSNGCLEPGHVSHGDINGDVVFQDSEEVTDKRPLILVTLMIMLVVCANRIHTIVMDQFLYQTFAKAVFGNVSVDISSNPCVNGSKGSSGSGTETYLLHQVQEQASGMTMYLDITSYGIGILSSMILGTYSSTMSRKLLLLVPATGYLIRLSLVPVVVFWSLDVRWFYLGYAVDGICGNSCGILLGTFIYTTDVTPRNAKRTLGITIVETVKGAVGAAFYVVSGQLIVKTGFLIPALVSASIQFLAVLVICTLPDRRPTLSEAQTVQLKSLKSAISYMFSPYHRPKDRRIKRMVRLATAAYLLSALVHLGTDKVQNIYIMDLPYCFDAITMGWFLFTRDLIQYVFVISAVLFLLRRLPGMLLAIAGALSLMACCCMYAFAQTRWEILYIVTSLGVAQNIPFSVVRGQTSRLLGAYYQGPLFASLAVVENFGNAAGVQFFLSVYKSTLNFFPGFVFLTGAGLMSVAVILMCFFHVIWVGHTRSEEFKSLIASPSEDS